MASELFLWRLDPAGAVWSLKGSASEGGDGWARSEELECKRQQVFNAWFEGGDPAEREADAG